MNTWKKFIECDCKTEGIMVSHEEWSLPEASTGYKFPFIYLAFFKNYHTAEMSWKQKLRWTWHILCTGEPWGDMVVLNKDNAKALMDELKIFLASGDINENQEKLGSQATESTQETTKGEKALQQEFDFTGQT